MGNGLEPGTKCPFVINILDERKAYWRKVEQIRTSLNRFDQSKAGFNKLEYIRADLPRVSRIEQFGSKSTKFVIGLEHVGPGSAKNQHI